MISLKTLYYKIRKWIRPCGDILKDPQVECVGYTTGNILCIKCRGRDDE